MDGVMSIKTDKGSLTEAIIFMIMNSPHFQQIRVILFDREQIPPESGVSGLSIFEGTGKPVIVLGEGIEGFHPSIEGFMWNSRQVLSIGLVASCARRVLDVSTVNDSVPEALRAARLVVLASLPISDT